MGAGPRVSDVNVLDTAVLPAPELLCRELVRDEATADFVARARREIHEILFGDDKRLLVVLGPCSIHDVEGGRAYAEKLRALAQEVSDRLLLVMRVYFEKPRTTVGWKGLVMDPHLDGSADIHLGLRLARQFLLDVVKMGLPTATELLDPITPQYIADLICWSAIGARTAESQTHRQMASGLSMPMGFKNGTGGGLRPAVNAIKAASQPQTFLGISYQGLASSVRTRGNPDCHIILRGGTSGPNYEAHLVRAAREMLEGEGLRPAIMVDCSHDNAGKDPGRYGEIFRDVLAQVEAGDRSLIGVMIESNLEAGNQKLVAGRDGLVFGQSVTDPCIGWEETEALIREARERLGGR